ncbi:MAG: hypothetical protein SFY92_09160 [Verrucomicrobiae bacterium]|nr:hypothetical protein [Verrucomicrobiae bacterium]
MKFTKKSPLAGALVAVLLLGFGVWACWPRQADIRTFDPSQMAAAETQAWRDYYGKKPLALFSGLYAQGRRQGFSPCDSFFMAYNAGNAARTFQKSRSRQEAMKALPALEKYFRIVRRGSGGKLDPVRAAQLELEWWQQRRESKPVSDYAETVAAAWKEIYQTSDSGVEGAALIRCMMMDVRDSMRDEKMTEADWDRIREGLTQSYTRLKEAVGAKP